MNLRPAIAGVVLAALAACGESGGTETLRGTLTLHEHAFSRTEDGPCMGNGGFQDIVPGVEITLRDEQEVIIGVTKLAEGQWVDVREEGELVEVVCQWSYAISDVPDRTFYVVEVSDRGDQRYSKADLVERGWVVDLSLG